MKGVCLQFYMNEVQKHEKILLYEWILEQARKNNIRGATVFRAIAGYGGKGVFYEESFFELGSKVPIEVRFLVSKEESDFLLELIKKEKICLFYSIMEAEFEILN